MRHHRSARLALLCGCAAFAVLAAPVHAQQIPQLPAGTSAQDVQRIIQQRGLGDQIRQRVQQSGLTPDQIRARLRGAGYPENLIDQYLQPAQQGQVAPAPSTDVLRALSSLGFADFTLAADTLAGAESVVLSRDDSLLLDSLGLRLGMDSIPTRRDSVGVMRLDSAAAFRYADRLRRPQVFGLDVFRRTSTQFAPVLTGPVDPAYRIGPGDELVLIVTGEVELTQELPVTREGFVVIPQVGQVYASNLTMGQFTDVLFSRLGRVYASINRSPGARSQFQVAISKVRVNQVFVVGEVARPGSYPVSALGTVMNALYQAGGPTERADFRTVKVTRAGRDVAAFDLYDYLLNGNTRNDVRLEQGDVVFVAPRARRVLIQGSVVRPAHYDLAAGDGMRELVRMAGGLLAEAYTGRALIERILPPDQRLPGGRDRTVLDVSLDTVLAGGAAAFRLEPDDRVTVFPVARPVRDRIVLKGNVWHPGTFEAEPGLTLSRLIASAGGLKPDTYGHRAHILRLLPDSTRRLIPVDLGGRDDPELQEYDEVTVFSRTDFRPLRQIAVYGSVQRPGMYAYRDSMSLVDAVMLAGGLRDEAYLLEAEISRIPEDRQDANQLAVSLHVPLDSSYVLDPTGHLTRPTARRGENPALQPYDNVFIRRVPGYELQRNVVISGEVRFPGRYSLTRRDERLLDVLNRAGGVTEQAYIGGAQFYRADARMGRVGINLARVLRDAAYRDNVILFSGDSLYIPQYQPMVRVEGAVNSPVAVAYQGAHGADWYVTRAGGFARRADKSRTYVVQPNGAVDRRSATVEPGGRVVVPEIPADEQKTNWASILGSVAQILVSALTIALVVQKL